MSARGRIVGGLWDRAGRLLRDESGGVSVLLLPMFLMLLLATGLAIDLSVKEAERADLQNALDRGILAAASLSQGGDAQQIVQEYVDRRAFNDMEVIAGVRTTGTGAASREVHAHAILRSENIFLTLVGLPFIDMHVRGSALESRDNIEISLVLDISGSMAREETIGPDNVTRKRLEVMKAAAKKFITDTLSGPGGANTSITLVPFSGQVNAGRFFDELLAGPRDHGHSSCIEFLDDDFLNLELPPPYSRLQTPHFQHFTYERLFGQPDLPIDPEGGNNADWGWCPSDTQPIVPFSGDISTLHAAIDRIVGHDGTGSQYGLKWGLALLHPSTQPLIQSMSGAREGDVDPRFMDRPGLFGEGGPQKIVVVMTDGRIRHQNRPSPLDYSLDPGFYEFDENQTYQCWRTDPDGRYVLSRCPRNSLGANRGRAVLGSSAAEADDEDLRRAQFVALCDQAAREGIRVFTIAFGFKDGDALADAAKSMLKDDCPSSDGDFFNAQDGILLEQAFGAIVAEVQRLKLFR